MTTGVYLIRNLIDGEEYVGSAARGFASRWSKHRLYLGKGTHHSYLLQRAWNACGELAFEFSVLELCPPDKCIEREQHFIDLLKPVYNVCRVAGSVLGLKRKPFTPEHRAKLSAAAVGKVISPETRAKISAAFSPEYRTKMRDKMKGMPAWNKGKHPSPETRARMSAAAKGRGLSPESRAKVSRAQLGRKRSPETRAKMSIAQKGHHRNLGHTVSLETRAKISAALRIRKKRHNPISS